MLDGPAAVIPAAAIPAAPVPAAPIPEPAPLHRTLLDWYERNARDLPWRATDRTPWGVLVSEVMLQQTPVARVDQAWRAWMARWPTPAALADASAADVLRAWDRLGYPRRALRLRECACTLVQRHGGQVPDDLDQLRALPGIGEYTAAAVLAFGFGRRAVVLDTNVRRVLGRLLAGAALPPPAQTVAERRLAAAYVPADDATAARWSVATMELGALVCTARSPRCGTCPVADACRWLAAGRPGDEHAHRRRTQGFTGTDRQVRGRVMAVLRDALEPVPAHTVEGVWPDRAQLWRAVDALVADGLVEAVAATSDDDPPTYRLPA